MKQERNRMAQSKEQELVSTTTLTKRRKKLQAQSNKKTDQHKKMYGVRTRAILTALEQYGPQSRAELEQALVVPKDNIAAILSRLNRSTPRAGKQIHIVRYVYDAEGARRYPRAVYAAGDGVDVKKPPPQKKENKRRYEAKMFGVYRMNSVFNLGKSREQIRAERKMA